MTQSMVQMWINLRLSMRQCHRHHQELLGKKIASRMPIGSLEGCVSIGNIALYYLNENLRYVALMPQRQSYKMFWYTLLKGHRDIVTWFIVVSVTLHW